MDETAVTNESVSTLFEKSVSEVEDGATLKSGSSNPCNPGQMVGQCATVTEDSETFPKNISIDFGTGCTDAHGRVRTGIIHIHLTAEMTELGAVRTVTFENFHINEMQITGSRITTNTGATESGQPIFSRVVDVQITRPAGTFHRQFSGQVTWMSGFDTEACGDNVFSETGSGSVTRPNGVTVTRTITSPLIVDQTCGYITAGEVEMNTPQGTASINFGNGSCDDQAVLTRPNGTTETITLHH